MITLLQTLRQVAERSAIIAETDPHGIVISIVSITAVFLSLLIIFLTYLFIGKCVNRARKTNEAGTTPENADKDVRCVTNLITIRRKPKFTTSIIEDIPRIGNIDYDIEDTVATVSQANSNGTVTSPLPGIITDLTVNIGDKVSIGSELAVLEAMKMENSIESEYKGTVTEIYVSKGEAVLEGTPLMKIQ